jgi:hypothetical protein
MTPNSTEANSGDIIYADINYDKLASDIETMKANRGMTTETTPSVSKYEKAKLTSIEQIRAICKDTILYKSNGSSDQSYQPEATSTASGGNGTYKNSNPTYNFDFTDGNTPVSELKIKVEHLKEIYQVFEDLNTNQACTNLCSTICSASCKSSCVVDQACTGNCGNMTTGGCGSEYTGGCPSCTTGCYAKCTGCRGCSVGCGSECVGSCHGANCTSGCGACDYRCSGCDGWHCGWN